MGYFSELDHQLSRGKEYLRLQTLSLDGDMTPQEIEEEKILLWEEYGKPAQLTKEETLAILSDDLTSPAWQSGINKLTTESTIPPVTYKKRSNYSNHQ